MGMLFSSLVVLFCDMTKLMKSLQCSFLHFFSDGYFLNLKSMFNDLIRTYYIGDKWESLYLEAVHRAMFNSDFWFCPIQKDCEIHLTETSLLWRTN